MTDARTIAAYQDRVDDYAKMVAKAQHRQLRAFIAHLPAGAKVLDWGCGIGDSSTILADYGHFPDPVDAAPDMVAAARARGLPARQASFDDLTALAAYDAIWAHFSLLHVRRAALPGHIAQAVRALKPDGRLSVGLKLGSGERRDRLGRFYSYYSEDELDQILAAAGLKIFERFYGKNRGLAGQPEAWIVIFSQKTP